MSFKLTYDIYVGHLPNNIQERVLFDVFSKYGEVVDILCRFGKGPYGFGIVKFRYQEDADNILRETDKIYINGIEMEIKNAKRSSRSSENGNGAVYTKSASPSTAVSMQGMRCTDPPIPPPDYRYMFQHQSSAKNEKQLPVMIEVMCTSVENAVTFYGCPIFRCEELRTLSGKLCSICPNLTRLLRKPQENKIYAAVYGEDMLWYRALVLHAVIPEKPGMCIVQYIDYGNVDDVSYTNMVDLPEPIKKIPIFAVKCILSNLMCNPKSHCDISYLHHLVNQRMSLYALSAWGIPQYNVLKCSCNGIDVVSELVRNSFAVYRTPKNSKSPLLPIPERSIPKQGGQKPKNMNGSAKSSKKANEVKEEHSHAANCSPNEIDINIKCERSLTKSPSTSSDNSQREVPQLFVPKKIIKRGSDINDMGSLRVSQVAEVKDSINHLLKIDCVISNLKLVNNIRQLVSLKSGDNLINGAVDLLLTESYVKPSENAVDDVNVKEAHRVYLNTLDEIKNCKDQSLLADLKKKREDQKMVLIGELNNFLENFDYSVVEKKKTIQKMIMDLESNSNVWMNVYLQKKPATTEQLLADYNKEKEYKWNLIQRARNNTNEKHNNFIEFLEDLRSEFSLNLKEDTEEDVDMKNINKLDKADEGKKDEASNTFFLENAAGKKGSWALKLDETLSELGIALEEEIKTCNVSKGKNRISVIQCILEKLDIPKEKIDLQCEIYKKYISLSNGMNTLADMGILVAQWSALQERIKYLYDLCTTCDPDAEKKKTSCNFAELHHTLHEEDFVTETLTSLAALHFPELNMEHPELHLSEFESTCHLLKSTWKKGYFEVLGKCSRVEPAYLSRYNQVSCVIKEFKFTNESERSAFTKKAIVWKKICSKSIIKIEALFNRDENCVSAMFQNTYPSLLENPLPVTTDRKMACNVLHQILLGLKDIHVRGMTHGAVHPLAVLHHNGEILLDFNYDLRFLSDKLLIKGINFQSPCGEEMCKSADMYGFGCLVLWILFPNLLFSSTEQGVPNLSAFQSILEDLLSVKDFASLSALLSVNRDSRPSSKDLLASGFLKDLRIMPDSP